MNWRELAMSSQYETAKAIKQELISGNAEEATIGIEELIESLSRSDKRALRSQLIRLMAHIIKWNTQPERRMGSWAGTIENARVEIEELLELEPSLKPLVPGLLTELFPKSLRVAEKEMSQKSEITELSAQQVFEATYEI